MRDLQRWLGLVCLAGMGCTEFSIADKPQEVVTSPGETDEPVTDTAPPVDTDTDTDVPDDLKDDPPIPVAVAPVYANTRDTLYEVDPTTGAVTMIGVFQTSGGAVVDGMVDIAIDMTGQLYGGVGNVNDPDKVLYQIDPTTAVVTEVCRPPVVMYALTFTSEGLLVAGGSDTLHAISIENDCDFDLLVQVEGYETSGDLVGLPDGLLYWTIEGEDGDRLVSVNPETGAYTLRGDISFDRLFGLGFDESLNKLYGFSTDGEIVQIAPSNAGSGLVSQNLNLSWWGAATNPVVWSN